MFCKKSTNLITITLITLLVLSLSVGIESYADSFEEVKNLDTPYVKTEKEFYKIKDNFKTTEYEPTNPLALGRSDVMFIPVEDKGIKYIDIVIRKKKAIKSVLIVNPRPGKDCDEVYSDQVRDFGTVDYGLRALDYNKINGEEKRYHKGNFLGKKEKLFFLIDSTPETHPVYGNAYIIRMPLYVQYGYTWENFGLLRIEENMIINIRTFMRKHADYRGKFYNNCFRINTKNYRNGDAQNFRLWEEDIDQVVFNKEEFFVVTVRFMGHTKFFDFYTIKERKPNPTTINESPTRRIGYATMLKEVKSDACVLLESIYKDGMKLVRARLYIKKDNIERDIEINMLDQKGISCVRPLHYIIPAKGSTIPSIEPSNPKWTDKAPFVREDERPLPTVNPEDRTGDVIEEDPRI